MKYHIDKIDICCPINFSPKIMQIYIENFKYKKLLF